jgi:hypothetical protein
MEKLYADVGALRADMASVKELLVLMRAQQDHDRDEHKHEREKDRQVIANLQMMVQQHRTGMHVIRLVGLFCAAVGGLALAWWKTVTGG